MSSGKEQQHQEKLNPFFHVLLSPPQHLYTYTMQATKNMTVGSDGWTQVPKRSTYVPPHARKVLEQVAREEAKKVDFSSTSQFPTLGASPVKTKVLPDPLQEAKTSFKEKIDGLIAFEQLTEQEKQARLQAKRAMDGFAVLSLRLTPEVREDAYQSRQTRNDSALQWDQDVACGIEGMISLESYKESKQPPVVSSHSSRLHTPDYDDEEEEYVYAEEPDVIDESI